MSRCKFGLQLVGDYVGHESLDAAESPRERLGPLSEMWMGLSRVVCSGRAGDERC